MNSYIWQWSKILTAGEHQDAEEKLPEEETKSSLPLLVDKL